MTTQNISLADNPMLGRGRDRQVALRSDHYGYPGVPVMVPTWVSLGTPDAADADLLVKAATGTQLPDTETITYTTATDGTAPLNNTATPAPVDLKLPNGSTVSVWPLDVPRNLAAAVSATAVVAMDITVSGYDQYRRPMTETLSIAATGTSQTATGAKAWAYIESIAITAEADASGNTLNLGTGSKLGLPYRLANKAHLLGAFIGGVQELVGVASNATVVAAVSTTASATTGDVRGTITFNGSLTGSAEAAVWMYVAGHATGAGIAGVAQA